MPSALPWVGRENASTIIAYAAVGVLMGIAVNRLNKFLDASMAKPYRHAWAAVPLKMVPVALVLLVGAALAPGFARDWQSTTPGLVFITFFFGMQTSLMEDAAKLA